MVSRPLRARGLKQVDDKTVINLKYLLGDQAERFISHIKRTKKAFKEVEETPREKWEEGILSNSEYCLGNCNEFLDSIEVNKEKTTLESIGGTWLNGLQYGKIQRYSRLINENWEELTGITLDDIKN